MDRLLRQHFNRCSKWPCQDLGLVIGGHDAIITRFSQSPGITRALDLCSVGCWYETGIYKITPLTHLFGKTSWCSGTAFVPHALPWQSLGCNEVKTYQHGKAMLNP